MYEADPAIFKVVQNRIWLDAMVTNKGKTISNKCNFLWRQKQTKKTLDSAMFHKKNTNDGSNQLWEDYTSF